jgi:SAM-dependent methyltransferase
MGLLSKIFSNTRKPEGFFGKMMVNGMNGGGHAQMANWALSSVQIKENGQILDIGCGGGANIARLLQRAPKSVVQGIDYSPVSVAKSSKVNAKAIAEGRCKVQEASVVKLPFSENTFDLVTAFETIYFWRDIEHCFDEVKRVLKPGGQFVIVNESDGSGPMDAKWESLIEGMHTYKPEEIRLHLSNAGFKAIDIRKDEAQTLVDGDGGEISFSIGWSGKFKMQQRFSEWTSAD